MNYAAARGEELDYRRYRPAVWSLHPGWIVLTILGFLFWWPIGLGILAFTLWNRKLGCWGGDSYEHWQDKMERVRAKFERFGQGEWTRPSSGNRAFDEYRTATLERLEEEQRDFREFLRRLRMAKDKQEFDQFMAERRNRSAPTTEQA